MKASLYDKLGDFKGTVSELEEIVKELRHTYGPNAVVEFNAGYNNIDCYIKYEPGSMSCIVSVFLSNVCVLGTKGCNVEDHMQ